MIGATRHFFQHDARLNHFSLGLSAITSIEMGVRTVVNLSKLSGLTDESEKQAVRKDLSADLSGALFFGLAAANLFPGTRKTAGLIFIGRSFYVFFTRPDSEYREKEYWTGRLITIFPDKAYQGYQWVKSQLNLPFHSTWYGLIGLIALVGYYQFGGNVHNLLAKRT